MTTVNHHQHVRGREKAGGDSEREKETRFRGTGQAHFLPGPGEYVREDPTAWGQSSDPGATS